MTDVPPSRVNIEALVAINLRSQYRMHIEVSLVFPFHSCARANRIFYFPGCLILPTIQNLYLRKRSGPHFLPKRKMIEDLFLTRVFWHILSCALKLISFCPILLSCTLKAGKNKSAPRARNDELLETYPFTKEKIVYEITVLY